MSSAVEEAGYCRLPTYGGDSVKESKKITWARQVAAFSAVVLFVTTCISVGALLRDHSVEAIISRLSSIDLIVSIFLVSISVIFWGLLRHQIFWLVVTFAASLIWQEVGFPLILLTPFDQFSWIPALVTLGMEILFWVLEALEAKYIGASEDEDMISLDLNKDRQ